MLGKVFVEASSIAGNYIRFIDTRFQLQDRDWGKSAYEVEHIRGAVYWHLEDDLSDMSSPNGRHPMPTHEQLQAVIERSGLRYEETIYVYDQGGAPFAPRAWWMLKYAGFPNVYIVNGGFQALKEAGFNVVAGNEVIAPSSLTLHWNETIYASRSAVKSIVDGEVEGTLLDARSAVRYRGEQEPLDKVAGHIPTAINYDWEQVIQGNALVPPESLLAKVSKEQEIVVYCGSGVTASPLYAVLADMGYNHVRLYVGSYSDWITVYEVEKGVNE